MLLKSYKKVLKKLIQVKGTGEINRYKADIVPVFKKMAGFYKIVVLPPS